MTVNTNTPSKTYTAAAAATVFPYDFRIFTTSDLHVTVDGSVKTLSTHYTVSGADNPAGGNVTFITPMVGGEIVVIAGDIPAERDTDYQEGGDLLGKTHNDDHDYAVMLVKQLLARAVLLPLGDADGGSMELPSLAARANKYATYGADGRPSVADPASGLLTGAANVYFLAPGGQSRTLQDMGLDDVCVFNYMTAADILLVRAGATVDVTYAGTLAVATGKSVWWPQGKYTVSPITSSVSGALVGPPPAPEINRTSLWNLASKQKMYGDGAGTQLVWGTPGTKQCFFAVTNANDVAVEDMSFADGYAALVVDPVTDGSVDTAAVKRCYFSNLLADVVGGRQWAVYTDSKYSKNISVVGCRSRGCLNHSIIFTNTYNARATDNDFTNLTNGFCIDASQGTNGVVISNNTGETVKYFCKVESSQSAGNTAEHCASHRAVITGNEVKDISTWGIFLNGAADMAVIEANVLSGFEIGIIFDTVTAYTHNGNVQCNGNVLKGNSSGTSIGIQDTMTSGTRRHQFANNDVDNVTTGYKVSYPKAKISGGAVTALGVGVLLDSAGVLNGISVVDVTIDSGASAISVTGSTAFKRLKVRSCTLTFAAGGAVYAPSAAASLCDISGNTCDGTIAPITGIYLKTPQSCMIRDNQINTPAGIALNAIVTLTSTTDCLINGNESVKALDIQGAAGTTDSTGNIITAYVA